MKMFRRPVAKQVAGELLSPSYTQLASEAQKKQFERLSASERANINASLNILRDAKVYQDNDILLDSKALQDNRYFLSFVFQAEDSSGTVRQIFDFLATHKVLTAPNVKLLCQKSKSELSGFALTAKTLAETEFLTNQNVSKVLNTFKNDHEYSYFSASLSGIYHLGWKIDQSIFEVLITATTEDAAQKLCSEAHTLHGYFLDRYFVNQFQYPESIALLKGLLFFAYADPENASKRYLGKLCQLDTKDLPHRQQMLSLIEMLTEERYNNAFPFAENLVARLTFKRFYRAEAEADASIEPARPGSRFADVSYSLNDMDIARRLSSDQSDLSTDSSISDNQLSRRRSSSSGSMIKTFKKA